MAKVSYEQAREDHEYLWSIAAAYDMTGGYTDQEDLERLLHNPTKSTARDCYVSQIIYWFQVGPTDKDGDGPTEVPWEDPRVVEIAQRHSMMVAPDEGEDYDDDE